MTFKIGVLISTLLILVGCKSTTNFDYDDSVNFSEIKTYAWIVESKTTIGDPEFFNSSINNKRITAAIERNLADKGLRKVAPSEANVLVNFHANVKEKLDTNLYNGYSSYSGFGRRYYGSGFSGHININNSQRDYKEGALVIDFLNQQKQLIWRGSDETRLSRKSTPDKRSQQVNEVVSQILLNFLPTP